MAHAPCHRPPTTRAVLIAHTGDTEMVDTINNHCREMGFNTAIASSADEINAQHRDFAAIIMAGKWDIAKGHDLLSKMQSSLTNIAVIVVGDASHCCPVTENPDIIGKISLTELPGALNGLLSAASEVTSHRMRAATEREEMLDLLRILGEPFDPQETETMMNAILQASVSIIQRETGQQARGAVLLLDDDGQFIVRAAYGAWTRYLHAEMPASLLGRAAKTAERKSITGDGRHLFIPMYHFERTRGVIVIEGDQFSSNLSPLMQLMVKHGSCLLENAILYDLAVIDSTTRLFARHFILRRIYESMKLTYRVGQDMTILMLDLDRFKEVNDQCGHLIGDRVLREVGSLISDALRETDIVGRYGGDEFLVVLPNTPVYGAMEVAERLHKSVQDYRLSLGDEEITVGISIGIGGIRHGEHAERYRHLRPNSDFFHRAVDTLITQADGLMYRAKLGHSPVHIASGYPLEWGMLLNRDSLMPAEQIPV